MKCSLSIFSRGFSFLFIGALGVGFSLRAQDVVTTPEDAAAVGCTPAPSGLISWWKAENNPFDSVDGNNGSANAEVTYAPGPVGSAFQFSGADPRISLGDPENLKLTNSLTIEGWVWINALPGPNSYGFEQIFFRGDTRAYLDPYFLAIDGSSGAARLCLHIENASGSIVNVESGALQLGRWIHVAGTLEGATGTMRVYTNGVMAAQTSSSIRPFRTLNSTANVAIGNTQSSAAMEPFNGLIDELAIYDRALTPSEIAGIYAAGSAGKCPPPLPPPTCTPVPSGLISWWKGENDATDRVDGNDGTLVNGASFAVGEVGQGFQFSGNSQAVIIPHSSSLITANYTVEAWVKPATQVSDPISQDLIFGQSFGYNQMVVRPGTTGLRVFWQFGTSHSSFYGVLSTNDIPIGQFSHLVGTWDGVTLRLYINGALNAQTTPGTAPVDSGCPFYIGGFYSPAPDSCAYTGQYFNGVIDEVSYFNRALTANEIHDLYTAGGAGKCGDAPVIVQQPLSQRVNLHSNATFTVTAVGSPTLRYQWRFNGDPISGETAPLLVRTDLQYSNTGIYSVLVSNDFGFAISSDAILTVNHPPIPNAQLVVLPEDANTNITLTATDADGDSLTYALVIPPAHGTLSGTGSTRTYEPNPNYFGPDGFTFNVSDGLTTSGPALVSITVLPVNDPPVAYPQSLSVNEDTPLPMTLTASDVDGDALTYTVSAPAHGTLTGQAPLLTYQPATNYFGPDSFTFHVNDGHVDSAAATVSISVAPVNDAPMASMSVMPLTEFCGVTNLVALAPDDTAAVLVLDGSLSSDVESDPLQFTWMDGTNFVATGPIVTNAFTVGTHDLILLVSDGMATGIDSRTVEVITRAESVAVIVEMVEQSSLGPHDQKPLIVSLNAAAAAFERGNSTAAINQLQAFKNKVRAQVAPVDKDLAQCLRAAADAVIQASLGRPDRVRFR